MLLHYSFTVLLSCVILLQLCSCVILLLLFLFFLYYLLYDALCSSDFQHYSSQFDITLPTPALSFLLLHDPFFSSMILLLLYDHFYSCIILSTSTLSFLFLHSHCGFYSCNISPTPTLSSLLSHHPSFTTMTVQFPLHPYQQNHLSSQCLP